MVFWLGNIPQENGWWLGVATFYETTKPPNPILKNVCLLLFHPFEVAIWSYDDYADADDDDDGGGDDGDSDGDAGDDGDGDADDDDDGGGGDYDDGDGDDDGDDGGDDGDDDDGDGDGGDDDDDDYDDDDDEFLFYLFWGISQTLQCNVGSVLIMYTTCPFCLNVDYVDQCGPHSTPLDNQK